MNEHVWLSTVFETYRKHLHGVAYRMLGSMCEAEDAVQEAWLRLTRAESEGIQNMGGWLTAVVSRVCLDMLRARKSRREQSIEVQMPDTLADQEHVADPEREALLADSVGVALLVVLDKLSPSERIAFILHDVFGMSFAEIASIVGKSEAAARQLASRARRRVRGVKAAPEADHDRQRDIVRAFLAAAHAGDFDALIAALDPDVVLRDDRKTGEARITRGAAALAKQVAGRAQKSAQLALVDGVAGIVAAPRGKLLYALKFTIIDGTITEVDLISDREALSRLDLVVPES